MTPIRDNSQPNLMRLLNLRNEEPHRTAEIDAEIMRNFNEQRAIFVLDMCGFSRTVQERGIIEFLARIERIQTLVSTSVRQYSGLILKAHADNVFAIFETADDALQTALDSMNRVQAVNLVLPRHQEMYLSIGIGYGP